MQQETQEQKRKGFNPNEHLIQLKSKQGVSDYLPVQWRLVWFREQCPGGTLEAVREIIDLDREITKDDYVWNNEKRRSEKVTKTARGFAYFRYRATDGKGGVAEMPGSESAVDFPDYIEKAATKAAGRALAALGYGTQFTGEEFDEKHRIVDSPVDRPSDTGSTEDQKIRLAEIGKQARAKGLIPQEAKLSDVLKLASGVLEANITALGHMTPSRFEELETYVTNAKPQLEAVR